MRQDKTNVIDFTAKRKTVVPRPLRELEACWELIRDGRLVPDRAELDPRGFPTALPHSFLLERIAPGLARIRVAGRHLSDLMGINVQGLPFTSHFVPEARPAIIEALSAVFEEPATARLRLSSAGGIGRQALTSDLVILPLRDDLGDVTRAVGCLVTEGVIGRTPRRFAVEDVALQTLIGFGRRASWPKEDRKPEPAGHGKVVWLTLKDD